jgi:hypothetical protein
MLKLVWKYYIPVLVFLLGLLTWIGDPNKPMLKSIPIIPGEHQTEISVSLMILALILGLIICKKDHGAR